MYIVNDDIPLGCIYEGENGKTKYCPMLNHDDVPYCQYLEDDEVAIGIDERPVYCPIVEFPYTDVPYTNTGDTISRQAAIDELEERKRANGYSNTALVSELNRSIGYLMRLPSAQPEITEEDVREWCHKRGLTLIDNALYLEMRSRWFASENAQTSSQRF